MSRVFRVVPTLTEGEADHFYRQWAEGHGVLYQFVKKLVEEARDFGYEVTLINDAIIIKKEKK